MYLSRPHDRVRGSPSYGGKRSRHDSTPVTPRYNLTWDSEYSREEGRREFNEYYQTRIKGFGQVYIIRRVKRFRGEVEYKIQDLGGHNRNKYVVSVDKRRD